MADAPVIAEQTNAFGRRIPPLAECVNSADLRSLISQQLLRILPPLKSNRAEQLICELFDVVAENADDLLAAHAAHQLLDPDGVMKHLRKGLSGRSDTIVQQISPYLHASQVVLDYGCGDGTVGLKLQNDLNLAVTLCDVMQYLDPAVREARLPFMEIPPLDGELLFSESFDTVLLLTVLHHCEDPEHTLQQVRKLHPRRVVAIESVYAVKRHDLLGFDVGPGTRTPHAEAWLDLSEEDQFRYAYFWDWFYNKVVHEGVVVPCNFLWPDDWKSRFSDVEYKEHCRNYLGLDQPLVPEFHVLQVFTPLQ